LQARAGKFAEALLLARSIKYELSRVDALVAVADALPD